MTRKHKRSKRTAEVSMVTGMLVAGFAMVAWSMAITMGMLSPA